MCYIYLQIKGRSTGDESEKRKTDLQELQNWIATTSEYISTNGTFHGKGHIPLKRHYPGLENWLEKLVG
jgi:hypothetical protein